MPLLHGVLHATIHEAVDLATTRGIQAVGCLKKYVCCGMLPDLAGSCDPYLRLNVGGTRRLHTRFIQSTQNPVWNERFEIFLADEADELKVEVKDADVVGADFLGQAIIPATAITSGKVYDAWLDLMDETGTQQMFGHGIKGKMRPSRVHISLQFVPVDASSASGGIAGEVPRTYFPLRPGGRVTLYHDAVCKPGPVDGIPLSGGGLYSESCCWDDMYQAIQEARRFIWITGWSIWTDTMLQRRPAASEDSPSLGELLVEKANRGVQVLLLVWDDTTNNSGLHSGVMATHDQETKRYFQDTEVVCVLCPRQGGDSDSYLQYFQRGTMFTHHQKTLIVDSPIPAGTPTPTIHGVVPNKRVLAFVGGLDLTNGRYDDHTHPLFDTIAPGGPHEKDMYQGCVDGFDDTKSCPRQPWHDIHARVEGPAAIDVALNFMERWSKQAGKHLAHKLSAIDNHDDLLLPAALRKFASKRHQAKGRIKGAAHLALQTVKAHDPHMELPQVPQAEAWSVQVFRTIDSDSASGFPDSTKEAYEAGLSVSKGKVIDASIHHAYIELIRKAKRYIYVENQYFLGSAHLWETDNDTPCYNQVPAELALKIVNKIKAREPFCVYVVIPMYPEGVPTSASGQAILYYQTLTRQMMYKRIAAAIKEAGLEASGVVPTDYLQFFCLGKREASPDGATACPEAAVEEASATPGAPEREQQMTAEAVTAQAAEGAADGDDAADTAAPLAGAVAAVGNAISAALGAGAAAPTPQEQANAARRFMVYVHSKLMIVDDEYIILGSANINQRSLDGRRDSEICIGAFQSSHTMSSASAPLPRGQVAGFRKALWMEHTGSLLPEAEDPSSRDCMAALTRVGAANWEAYLAPECAPLPHGHLMLYPTTVGPDGSVGSLPECEEVPDLGGRITGTKSAVLPSILTT